jgi:hypothetical protein
MKKLVGGDRDEIANLLQTLSNLDHNGSDDDELSLDHLLDALQEDLLDKLRASRDFSDEMDIVARERDFYFDKLRRISEAALSYPPESVSLVTRIVDLTPKDFQPVESD